MNYLLLSWGFFSPPLLNPVTLSWDKSDSTHSPLCYNRSCHFQHAPVAFLASRLCPSPHFNFFSQTRSATECNSTHAHTARHDANITAPPTQPELARCETFPRRKRKRGPRSWNAHVKLERTLPPRSHGTAKLLHRSFSSEKFPPTATQQRRRWRQEPVTARSLRPFRSKIHTFLTHHRTLHTPPTDA